MEKVNFIENLATRLAQNASIKNVYGDPITADGKTIIPVARVAYGFGGGYGEGKNKKLFPANDENEKGTAGEGAGGGGGLYAAPAGVYEITGRQTRFIPVNNNKQLLVAALFGYMIRGWLMRKKKG